ncbi:hypothetical protein [Pseudonocardia sp.]|uniref:hypothetical protein n=1 Tax=Pseudonocardia sp. TaxID=60912 RepID=UPI0031FCFF7E
MAVPMAMPKKALSCCTVFRIPTAVPSTSGATAFIPVAAMHGIAIDTPTPAMISGAA